MSPGQGRKLLPASRDELGQAGEGCAGIPLMCVSLAGVGGRCLCVGGGCRWTPLGLSSGPFWSSLQKGFERLNMSFQGHKTSHRGIFAPIQIEKIHHSLRKVHRKKLPSPKCQSWKGMNLLWKPHALQGEETTLPRKAAACRAVYNHCHRSSSYCRQHSSSFHREPILQRKSKAQAVKWVIQGEIISYWEKWGQLWSPDFWAVVLWPSLGMSPIASLGSSPNHGRAEMTQAQRVYAIWIRDIVQGCFFKSCKTNTVSVLVFEYFYLFIYFGVNWVLIAAHGLFSSCSEQRLPFIAVCRLFMMMISVVGEHGLQAARASVVAVFGLRSCGSQALEHRLNSCGTWA